MLRFLQEHEPFRRVMARLNRLLMGAERPTPRRGFRRRSSRLPSPVPSSTPSSRTSTTTRSGPSSARRCAASSVSPSDRRARRSNAGITSCSKRRRLDHARSGGMPPHSGWNIANGNGAARSSSTYCVGRQHAYWPVARSSSMSSTAWYGEPTSSCGLPRAVGVGLVEEERAPSAPSPRSGSSASATTRFSPMGHGPGSGRPSSCTSSR